MKITNLSLLILLSVALGACAVKRTEPEANPPASDITAAQTPVSSKQDHTPASDSPPAVVKHATQPTPHAHSDKEPKTVPADKALSWLKNGNTRYLSNKIRKDGQSPADIARLSKGQHPHAIVLSCSDSRVPPEIVFDQKLGEIFVVRTAGEDPDASALASIEYAIEHLHPQLLVVMGHTSCGAVKAAIEVGDKDAGSPALNTLVHNIQPRLGAYQGRMPSSELKDESWQEADGVAKDLMAKSEIIKKSVESGKLKIVTALYQTSNGKVDFSK